VGARATIAGRASVFGDVPAGETWSGYPARPHKEQLRTQAAVTKLARLLRPLELMVARFTANTDPVDSSSSGDAA
jgi:UDP-3-O-[3-hydroxymyristoyl] glucosamine N-acyltransferase